jgi:hypothetical protein
MDDPCEHALVLKAFALACGSRSYVQGYVEWKSRSAQVARERRADLDGLTPEAIREMAIDFVNAGGTVVQRKEDRPGWHDYRFSYRIVMPADGFVNGIFVEFALNDDDQDDPTILIVSAHKQGV